MTKPKFTKGPWKIGYKDGSCKDIITSNTMVICPLRWAYEYMDEESFANSKLIAAAPDLYEALESIVRAVEKMGCEGSMLELAKQALSRARGE